MSNINDLASIQSVCTTSEELIKSEDFIKWLTIILENVKTFNKNYILSLFIKLQNSETLNDEEKEYLSSFVSDSKVSRLGQNLLLKLGNVSVNVKTNNASELTSFSELLNSVFTEDWFKKVQSYIWEVANITELTLNEYEWMRKLKIEVNWEEKEVYMDEENLKVDSSEWKEKEIGWVKVKINPEWDITEYLEWELAWEQLFTWDAAMRESKKQWKRLPFADDDNKEFQAIIEKVWVKKISKLFPGCRDKDGSDFCHRGRILYLCSASSIDEDNAYYMYIGKGDSYTDRYWDSKTDGLSVRCLKD